MPISSDSSPQRPSPYLCIEQVSAGYGGAPIVSEVEASVALGEVVSIIGPNGAGKSTLLKAVIGMIAVMRGTVVLGGEDITNLPTDQLARKAIGFVPQNDDVFQTLTVAENLEMGGYMLSKSTLARRTEEVLSVFPVLATMLRRDASKLSGGERKMTALARVLMPQPSLLILDEPTSNLSPDISDVLLNQYVRQLADAGTAILMVEQKARAALQISNWAYVMAAGTIQMSAAAGELLARDDLGEILLGRAHTR